MCVFIYGRQAWELILKEATALGALFNFFAVTVEWGGAGLRLESILITFNTHYLNSEGS